MSTPIVPPGNARGPNTATPADVAARGPLEKFLAIFTDVRAGEAPTAMLLALNVFLLLAAYYLLKVVREPLILSSGGAKYKVYASAVMAVLLIPLLKLFELLSERVDRLRLIGGTTGFFVACLGLFAMLSHTNAPIGFPFFVWVGIFNVFVIAQFWAFANDLYSESQGKRLFPIVAIGSSIGAIVGGKIAGALFDANHLDRMFALTALVLCISFGLTFIVNRREKRRAEQQVADEKRGVVFRKSAVPEKHAETLAKGGGFRLLVKDRYLVLIAVLAVVYNCVNTIGEFVLDLGIVNAAHGTAAQVSAFEAHYRANFFTVVNIIGLVLQLFVVSRVLRFLGVRVALFVMPVISLLGYSSIALFASLAVMSAVKTAENSVDYSLQNTTRQALFLTTTREAKYKAKALIDTFFVRMGDVVAAVIVYVGTGTLALSVRGFATLNIVLAAVWLVVVWRIGVIYRARSESEGVTAVTTSRATDEIARASLDGVRASVA